MTDYYKDLGVDKDATQDEIKRAYKKAAQKLHPDRDGGSVEEFKQIQGAYRVIGDKTKRERYDRGEDVSKPEVTREQKAAHTIASLFEMGIEAADQTSDFIQAVRDQLAHREQLITAGIADGEKYLAQVKKLLKRVTFKGEGSNLFAAALESKKATAHFKIDQLLEEGEVIGLCAILLDDYECSVEAEVPHTIHHTTVHIPFDLGGYTNTTA